MLTINHIHIDRIALDGLCLLRLDGLRQFAYCEYSS